MLEHRPVRCAVIVVFLTLAALLPFLDFRGEAFFGILFLFIFSPLVLAEIALWFALVYVIADAVFRTAARVETNARALRIRIVALSATLCFNTWLTVSLTKSEPEWITKGVVYHAVAETTALALVVVLVLLLLAVPLGALIVGINLLLRRRRSGWLFLGILPAAYGCFSGGTHANELLTVRSCAQGIQSAIRGAHEGRRLPPLSQAYPYQVLDEHGFALCALGGILGTSDYIVYDAKDVSDTVMLKRMGISIDTEHCTVRVTKVIAGYDWVSEAC